MMNTVANTNTNNANIKIVIKRDGITEQAFNPEKIVNAICLAFKDIEGEITNSARALAQSIATIISQNQELKLKVEDIQDEVEELLMSSHRKDVAKAYIQWRYRRQLVRNDDNTSDQAALEMLEGKNEYWTTENSNKNVKTLNVQRDYLAGIMSKRLARNVLIEKDLITAHDEGLIHIHDLDYYAECYKFNCALLNLEEVLQYGTVINGVKIDKPRTLRTAANIASQCVCLQSSNQFGGVTITLAHLAPFVEESRKRYRERFSKIIEDPNLIEQIIELEIDKEIKDSTQLLVYQLNTLSTTNGQAPFVSVCLDINEIPDEDKQTKEDLAKLIKATMEQRFQGFKNEQGVWITPAFPKLLYFLDENNIKEGTKYWDLTLLAAKTTAKRMTPDFISSKKMRELKKGYVYPCMGAVEGKSIIHYKFNDEEVESTFEDFWNRMCDEYKDKLQNQPGRALDLYIDSDDGRLFIKDTCFNWVRVKKLTRIINTEWIEFKFRWHYEDMEDKFISIKTTIDHPFLVFDPNSNWEAPSGKFGGNGYRRTEAKDIKITDYIHSNIGRLTIDTMRHYYEPEAFAYDVETESDTFEVNGLWSNNCRSFLTPDSLTENVSRIFTYEKQKKSRSGVVWSRFNQGVTTINLPDAGLTAKREYDNQINDDDIRGNMPSRNQSLDSIFWRILDERLDICHKALRARHERLCQGTSDMSPTLYQHGTIARLGKGESIKPLLLNDYSTISVGYIGLYECVKALTGEDHSKGIGKELGLKILRYMNDKCNEWKSKEHLSYSLYAAPSESLCYRFAKTIKQKFGEDVFIKLDGHDRNYLTNGYHLPVFMQPLNPFDKLSIESEFQDLTPGGAISYIECADLTKNIPVVLQVIQFMYDNILYAEFNTKSDYCMKCGFDGEIKIVDKDNKLQWQCPNCGNMDQGELVVSRRTSGYIGTNFWNQGKTNEIRDRYVHLDDHEECCYYK